MIRLATRLLLLLGHDSSFETLPGSSSGLGSKMAAIETPLETSNYTDSFEFEF